MGKERRWGNMKRGEEKEEKARRGYRYPGDEVEGSKEEVKERKG